MTASILVLFVVPWLDTSPVRSARFRPVFKVFFWTFVADSLLLVFACGKRPKGTWLILSRFGTAYYFLHFLIVLPLVGKFEQPKTLPTSIRQPVLRRSGGKDEIQEITTAEA